MSRVSPTSFISNVGVTCVYAVTLIALWFSSSAFLFGSTTSGNSSDYSLLHMPYVVKEKKAVQKPKISGKPAKILIPSLGIEKAIEDGIYNPELQTWTLRGKSIHYALLSEPVNDYEGNTLLYGHNNKNVFADLKNIQIGGIVNIFTDDNKKFSYTFVERADYDPSDTSIFEYSGPPILTLQTCSGPLNEIRSLYLFKFHSVVEV